MKIIELNPRKILIREPFFEQYTVIIKSETKAITAHMTSKVRMRWSVQFSEITENSLECRLIKTEHVLLEKNNDIIDEIMMVSEIFGRIYSELHVRINHFGQVIEVLNQNQIIEKWEELKDELRQKLNETQVKEVFLINDSIIKNPNKIRDAAQAQEFFQIYFQYVFNYELPYINNAISGLNFFNTANVMWKFETIANQPIRNGINLVSVKYKGKPSSLLNIGFYNKAYGQFSDKIDISSLSTDLSQKGEYEIYYPSGKVQKARILKEEIADSKELFTKLSYELVSDSARKEKNNKVQVERSKDPSKSFLAD